MKSTKSTIHKPVMANNNYTIIKDKDFGDILFGCPPEIIKSFNLKRITIPPYIVIPQRTFRKGRIYFDLEFVVYSVLFTQQSRKSITIVCTKSQDERIKAMLQEALFGPYLKDIFRTFLFESFNGLRFNKHQTNSLKDISEQIGSNREMFTRFKEIMSLKLEETKTLAKLKPALNQFLENISWINKKPYNHIYQSISKAYLKSAMLKYEMDVFSICEDEKRNEFINNFMNFHHFDSKGNITLTGKDNSKTKICQTRSGSFKLYKRRKLTNTFDVQTGDRRMKPSQIAPSPLEIPEFGITFVGSGTGFDPETNTNCFIIWIDGKGIAIDLLANCKKHFRRLGIACSDITHVFLSHLHSDHDIGILEKILIGEKIHLLTNNLIFDCFLRKAEAVTNFTKNSIKDFVYFTNLKEGKEVRIPGINRAYITFDYAFHSIPTGRFKLRYKSLSGQEMTIGFSSDTKYDKKMTNKLYKDGIITARRRDEILGFLWDCDLIIHEAGGGILHTEVKELMKLPVKVKKKCILTHTDQNTYKPKDFRFAEEGETISLIDQKYPPSIKDYIPLIKNTGLFPRFTFKQFDTLLRNTTIETYPKGQFVFKQGSIGHKFYIILSGFAEVIKDNKAIADYEKGNFFGELALINKDQKRRSSIKARSKLKLLVINRDLYERSQLSTITKERIYELANYFTDTPNSSLIGYISQGEFLIFMKGERIITFGDTSRDVYILISGEVDVLDAEDRPIAHVTNVEVLGEIAFLKRIPRTATVKVTSKEATTIRLNIKLFAKITKKFPFFYATILKKMEQRCKAYDEVH